MGSAEIRLVFGAAALRRSFTQQPDAAPTGSRVKTPTCLAVFSGCVFSTKPREEMKALASRVVARHQRPGILRQFNATGRAESALVLGGIGVAVAAMGAQYALQAYQNRPKAADGASASASASAPPTQDGAQSQSQSQTQDASTLDGAFSSLGASWADFKKSFFAKNFYDGGFDDKMTRREAALILGIRESAAADRVKEAHRRILLLNHPDRGGSDYLASKVNEAKDLLLKGTGTK